MRSCVIVAALLVATGAARVGLIDTVGGTTYDWQQSGPAYRTIFNSPSYGIHVVWMYSESNHTSFPDRNMRYNFFDYINGAWNWIDPDPVQSGVRVYTERSGCGNLAADPMTGAAVVSAQNGVPIRPVVARDMGPGVGLFEYCNGDEGHLWPYVATGDDGTIHCACMDDGTRERLFYTAVRTWCTWDSAVRLTEPAPDPVYPNHNIAASRTTPHVAVTWLGHDEEPRTLYYRESTDRGVTWLSVVNPPLPPAFGGDTGVTCDWMGAFPFYDSDGDLHIAVTVLPVVDSVAQLSPVELWHWCEANTPGWSRIHRAGGAPEHLRAGIGYNGAFADRPSIGEDDHGCLYVAWEQFDSTNVEPRTNLLRADIWFCFDNSNNGRFWHNGYRITDPDTTSKRFPCIVDRVGDWLDVSTTYMIDRCAGFFVQGEGDATDNPIVVHRFGAGLEERPDGGYARVSPRVPSILRGPDLASLDCRVLDIQGRDVTDRRTRLAPGVYFLRPSVDREPSAVQKVIIQR